uniref:Uncharacterized protein n=1 Tax=Coturnix japonica TaxID=93934 RepID=A0A8C2UCB3_COTJA
MAAERHFCPPEIPEPKLMGNVLCHGLFYGAVLQLLCACHHAASFQIPRGSKWCSHGLRERHGQPAGREPSVAVASSLEVPKESRKQR